MTCLLTDWTKQCLRPTLRLKYYLFQWSITCAFISKTKREFVVMKAYKRYEYDPPSTITRVEQKETQKRNGISIIDFIFLELIQNITHSLYRSTRKDSLRCL